jgi:hypothetical protein
MKRLSAVLFAALVATPSAADAQSVGAGAADVVAANASWVAKRGGGNVIFHFVDADRWVDPTDGGTNTIAEVGKVECSLAEDGRTIVATCSVLTRILFLKPRDFAFDPLLRSAQVILREKDATHTARWTVNENATPTPNYALHGDGRVVEVTASVRSGARARGRVFGTRFSTTTDSGSADLTRSVYGVVIVDRNEGSYRDTFDHRSKTRHGAWNWIERLVASR